MLECITVPTPMGLGTTLWAAITPDHKLPHRELIGSLNYLAVCTRSDIACSISKLSQYLTCYDKSHWLAAKRVLGYLQKTINSGLVFELDDKLCMVILTQTGVIPKKTVLFWLLLYVRQHCHIMGI
ncbi:hypothetical protein AVEN_270224-1 [Araneus ventricosus]|uniref:Retrovirus-related Pol polyprotein from transposon TNT 1-94 n=1 Tax=Araneus ventricosus TaxID=182803 RepID=A0A4Y2G0S1_ARAVE|nr:hypothetical protein AVEN_270224-1 [Araneus ventricosus]